MTEDGVMKTIYVVICEQQSAWHCYAAKAFTSEESARAYAASCTTSSAYYRVEPVTFDETDCGEQPQS